jgi:hypothetical protein
MKTPEPGAQITDPLQFLLSGTCSEEGAAISVTGSASNTALCSGGQWDATIDISGLNDGVFNLSADTANAIGTPALQVTRTFVKNASLPQATIINAPTGRNQTASLDVTVGGSGVAEYKYALVNASSCGTAVYSGWTPIATHITGPTNADGDKALCILGRDASSREQTSPTFATWVKDTVAPTIAFSSPAANAYVTSTSLTINGACDENNATITIGGAVSDTATCTGTTWTATISVGSLAEGSFTLTADVTDAAANAATSASRTFIKDTTAPTASLSGAPSGTSGASSLDVIVGGTGVTEYQYALVDGASCAAAPYGGWIAVATHIATSAGSDGAKILCVRGRDAAQNAQTAPTTAAWTLDTSVPTAALGGIPGNPSNATSLNVSVSGADVLEYSYALVDGSDCSGASYGGWTAVSTPITDAIGGDGAKILCVLGRDGSTTQVSPTTALWTKDSTQPALAFSTPAANAYVATASLALTGTCDEDGASVGIGGDAAGVTTCTSGVWSASVNVSALAEGTITLTADMDDAAGNAAPQASRSFVKDTLAPTASLGGVPASPSKDTTLDVIVSGTDVAEYRYAIVNGMSCSSASYGGWVAVSTHITGAIGADGAKILCVIGRDAALNAQSSPTSSAWIKDTVAPSVAITSPAANTVVASTSLSVTGSCNEDGATVTVGGAASGSGTCIGTSWNANIDITAVADGNFTLTADLEDAAHNAATQATRGFVKDTTPPAATLTGTPSDPSAATTLAVTVGGSGVTEYKYVLLSGSSCASATYSSWRSTSVVITDSTGADGAKILCVIGRDAVLNAQAAPTTALWTKVTNAAPTFTFVEPDGTNDYVSRGDSFILSWSDVDPDDNALITFFYKSAATGACNTGTKINGTATEDPDGGNNDQLSWSTAGVATGTYYICSHIDDGVNTPVETWSQAVRVWPKPTLTGPTEDWIKTSTAYNVTYSASGGTAPYTYSYDFGPSGFSIGSSTGTTSYTAPSTASDQTITIRVTDANGATAVKYLTLHVHSEYVCVWTGATSTAWGASSNWTRCGSGGIPTSAKWVVIPSAPANQPAVTSASVIMGFHQAPYGIGDGGTVTLSSGYTMLNLYSGKILSSVKVKGATATCADCQLSSVDLIANDATLSLDTGALISPSLRWYSIALGDGGTSGHIATIHSSSNVNQWPQIGEQNRTGCGIKLNGASPSNPSTLSFNGVKISIDGGDGGGCSGLEFNGNAKIKRFDNVEWSVGKDSAIGDAGRFISFNNCAGTTFSDMLWDNHNFTEGYNNAAARMIDTTPCEGIGTIQISGSGTGYDASRVQDPKGLIDLVGPTPGGTNSPPSLTIETPSTGSFDVVRQGEDYDIRFTAADSDDIAAVSLFARSGSYADCDGDPAANGWTMLTTSLTEGSDTSFTWSGISASAGDYYICGKIIDSKEQAAYAVSATTVGVLPDDMIFWVRADRGLALDTNDRVTAWTDLSGGGLDLAPAASGQAPLYLANEAGGYPVLRFDGAQSLQTASSSDLDQLAGLTYFAAVTPRTSNPSFAPIFEHGSATDNDLTALSLGGTGYGSSAAIAARVSAGSDAGAYKANAFDPDIAAVWGVAFDGGGGGNSTRLRIVDNYGFVTSPSYVGTVPTTTASSSGPLYVGRDAASLRLRGDIAEIMAFGRALSDPEIDLVRRYLTARYAANATHYDDFSTSSVDAAKWTTNSWQAGSASSVTNGALNLSGAQLRSVSSALASAMPSFEARVKVDADTYSNWGLATSFAGDASDRWIAFSTYNTTTKIFARVFGSAGADTFVELGGIPSGYATYKIVSKATGYEFYIDGVLRATITDQMVEGTTALRMDFSAYTLGSSPPTLQVDWVARNGVY